MDIYFSIDCGPYTGHASIELFFRSLSFALSLSRNNWCIDIDAIVHFFFECKLKRNPFYSSLDNPLEYLYMIVTKFSKQNARSNGLSHSSMLNSYLVNEQNYHAIFQMMCMYLNQLLCKTCKWSRSLYFVDWNSISNNKSTELIQFTKFIRLLNVIINDEKCLI